MAAPARVPLGASTTGTPSWVGVHGIGDFKPKRDSKLQEDADFDSGGFGSSTKTAEAWSVEIKVARKVTTASATVYDPGQEILRLKSAKMGPANSVKIRFYEMEEGGPRVEAYEGLAAVSWSPEGGGQDALDTVTVTLTGQGRLTDITHPDAP